MDICTLIVIIIVLLHFNYCDMSYVRVVVSFSHSLCHSLLLIKCNNYIVVFILVVIHHLPVSKWSWDTARKAFSVRDLVAEVSQGDHSVSHEMVVTPVMIMSKSVSVCS